MEAKAEVIALRGGGGGGAPGSAGGAAAECLEVSVGTR